MLVNILPDDNAVHSKVVLFFHNADDQGRVSHKLHTQNAKLTQNVYGNEIKIRKKSDQNTKKKSIKKAIS